MLDIGFCHYLLDICIIVQPLDTKKTVLYVFCWILVFVIIYWGCLTKRREKGKGKKEEVKQADDVKKENGLIVLVSFVSLRDINHYQKGKGKGKGKGKYLEIMNMKCI